MLTPLRLLKAHAQAPQRQARPGVAGRPALCLLASLLTLAAAASVCAAPARTWIAGATVISPERPDAGRKAFVLIEGHGIAAVTQTLPPDAARDATVVDASGLFLIPGLIDGHVHLQTVPGLTPLMHFRHPFLVKDYRAQLPRSFLRYGYTTVVDLLVTDPAAQEVFTAAPVHPDLYHCGGPLNVPDGYPSQNAPSLVRKRVFPNYVLEPQSGAAGAGDADAAAHTPAAAVARVKQAGGICIKTFFERGFGPDHDLPVPSPALFAGIVQAAHAAGLPVLLHASSLEAQRFGEAGGTDVFAHGLWNWGEFNGATTLPDPARELLDRIAARGAGYMPTLQVIGGLRVLYEPDYPDRPDVRRVIPKSLLDWLRTPEGHWLKDEMAGGAPDEKMRGIFDAILRRGAESTGYLARKGAFFLFGSDTPSGPTPGNLPGLNAYLEMQRLAAAGVSLRQLFEAATRNNAKVFGLGDRLGSIQPGKRANLLLLRRSPLASVEAYDAIDSIWIGGRRLDPASLEAGR